MSFSFGQKKRIDVLNLNGMNILWHVSSTHFTGNLKKQTKTKETTKNKTKKTKMDF